MEQDYTFNTIPLGSTVTYRGSEGFMKTGRVLRKSEALVRPFMGTEFARQSILVEIPGTRSSYPVRRVTITKFKNVRDVR